MGVVIAAQEQGSGVAKGPFEMAIADLGALGAAAFAGGLRLAFDQTTVGRKLLDGVEAVDISDVIEDGQCQNTANIGNGFNRFR